MQRSSLEARAGPARAPAGARILVVEDDRALRQALSGYLRSEGFDVVDVGDGLHALGLLRRGGFDIALIDVGLPQIDGLSIVREVRRDSTLPIILVTARAEASARIAGLDAGADDYVVKPCSMGEIGARIRAQLRRARNFAREPAVRSLRAARLELDVAARRCLRDGVEVALTRREFDLLAALLRSADHARTRDELLALAWSGEEVTPKTVDVHVASLRRKLGDAIAISAVRGVGYRLEAEDR